jgi:hypothetical protein
LGVVNQFISGDSEVEARTASLKRQYPYMEEGQILQKLQEMDTKLNEVHKATERTRKYILSMLVLSIAVIVLPLIALVFIIPQFLNIYSDLRL